MNILTRRVQTICHRGKSEFSFLHISSKHQPLFWINTRLQLKNFIQVGHTLPTLIDIMYNPDGIDSSSMVNYFIKKRSGSETAEPSLEVVFSNSVAKATLFEGSSHFEATKPFLHSGSISPGFYRYGHQIRSMIILHVKICASINLYINTQNF